MSFNPYYIMWTGRCDVYNELKKEKVDLDLETLVKDAKDFDENLSTYMLFMKERILRVSGNN